MAFTQSMAIVVLGYAELKANGEMMMPRLPEMLLCCSELRLEVTGTLRDVLVYFASPGTPPC